MRLAAKSKNRLPACLSLVCLVLSLGQACRSREAENARTAAAEQELEQLRESNQELQKLRAENQDLPRLRRDNEELARLREQTKDLERLRQENGQLRAELQALRAPKSPSPPSAGTRPATR